MKHRCVKCGQVYEKDSEEIINGCICGSRMFYFVREQGRKQQMEKEQKEYEIEDSVILEFDIETIKIAGSDKYEINIDLLMTQDYGREALVYKYGDGKYSLDINSIASPEERHFAKRKNHALHKQKQ